MKTLPKILIIVLLVGAVAGVLALKSRETGTTALPEAHEPGATTQESDHEPVSAEALTLAAGGETVPKPPASGNSQGIPKLIDLGADKCIPCKMMAPILEELKEEFAGRMEVVFIDVWENPDMAREYDVEIIPTQIFYDTAGKELFRHQGFYSREEILTKWAELGVDF